MKEKEITVKLTRTELNRITLALMKERDAFHERDYNSNPHDSDASHYREQADILGRIISKLDRTGRL